MICKKCKKNVKEGKKFCPNCGTPVIQAAKSRTTSTVPSFEERKFEMLRESIPLELQAAEEEKKKQEEERKKQEEEKKRQENLDREMRMKLASLTGNYATMTGDYSGCPYCGSHDYSYEKKGYSVGKGVTGAVLIGPYGLLAGAAGANGRVRICKKCGKEY